MPVPVRMKAAEGGETKFYANPIGRDLQIGYMAGCTPSSFGSNAATVPWGW